MHTTSHNSVFQTAKQLKTTLFTLKTLAGNPNRLDQILVLGETLNGGAFANAAAKLGASPEGAWLLSEQPKISSEHVDFAWLESLPDGTLGREYVRFLRSNNITPDVFKPPAGMTDPQAIYAGQRYRQTHDLWHVLTGYNPDIEGEILLQAFSFAQMKAPSALMITVLGTLRHYRTTRFVRRALDAFRRGRKADFLLGIRWEEHWTTKVVTLQEQFHCV